MLYYIIVLLQSQMAVSANLRSCAETRHLSLRTAGPVFVSKLLGDHSLAFEDVYSKTTAYAVNVNFYVDLSLRMAGTVCINISKLVVAGRSKTSTAKQLFTP